MVLFLTHASKLENSLFPSVGLFPSFSSLWPCHMARRISVPQHRTEPQCLGSDKWEALTTRPSGNSPVSIILEQAAMARSPQPQHFPPLSSVISRLCPRGLVHTCWVIFDSFQPYTGSSVHGTLQARILEWVAIFSSKGFS